LRECSRAPVAPIESMYSRHSCTRDVENILATHTVHERVSKQRRYKKERKREIESEIERKKERVS